jgi:flagellin
MVIGTNIAAQQSARLLAQSSANLSQSLARLSSGSKLISPEADPAGQAVTTRFDAQVHRLNAAVSVVSNWISYYQTQSSYADHIFKTLDRMGELVVLAQDVTKTDSDRALYNTEFQALASHQKKLHDNAKYGDIAMLDTTFGVPLMVDVPSDGNGGTMSMRVDFECVFDDIYNLGFNVSTAADAVDAKDAVDYVRNAMLPTVARNGAYLARLNYTVEELTTLRDNLTAATSRIRDVDVADESTRFAQNQILVQAGTAMLAQANASPESVLRLLA